MRSTLLVLILFFIITSTAGAQFRKSDVELTFSASFGSWESSSTSTWQNGNTTYKYNSTDSKNFLSLSISPGYYIFDGFSIEPELGMLAVEKTPPTFLLLGNISYTYSIPDSKIAPFGLIGYGISNAVTYPMYADTPIRTSTDLNVGILNAGGGVKIVLSSEVALRAEINYRKFKWTTKDLYGFYGNSVFDDKHSYIAFNFGFSVLL